MNIISIFKNLYKVPKYYISYQDLNTWCSTSSTQIKINILIVDFAENLLRNYRPYKNNLRNIMLDNVTQMSLTMSKVIKLYLASIKISIFNQNARKILHIEKYFYFDL